MNWNIDPILLHLGPLEIRYYGVFFALSLWGAYELAKHLFQQKKIPTEKLDTLAVYLIIGPVVGARFGHIVFYELDYYAAHPIQVLKVWEGGLSSHGATIGLLVSYGFFLWREKGSHSKSLFKNFFSYADPLVIAACLPVSFIRLGNFFNSELVGRPTDVPWAVQFTRVDSLARHPSQLYEMSMGLALLVILLILWRKYHQTARPGFFFGLFFTLYFAMRFTVEFVKDFPLHEGFLNLTTGQLLSIPFFSMGCIILLRTASRIRQK